MERKAGAHWVAGLRLCFVEALEDATLRIHKVGQPGATPGLAGLAEKNMMSMLICPKTLKNEVNIEST